MKRVSTHMLIQPVPGAGALVKSTSNGVTTRRGWETFYVQSNLIL